jgi:hypothetical protein
MSLRGQRRGNFLGEVPSEQFQEEKMAVRDLEQKDT